MNRYTLKLLCKIYQEMNIIRARDGVPYTHQGIKSDVAQEYWDSLLKEIDNTVIGETGRSAHCHPLLYDN